MVNLMNGGSNGESDTCLETYLNFIPSEYVSAQQVVIPNSIKWCYLVEVSMLITERNHGGGVALSLQ